MNNKITDNIFDLGDLVRKHDSPDLYTVHHVRKIPGQTPSYIVLNLQHTEQQHLLENQLTAVK